MTIVEQLTRIYFEAEPWHKTRMPYNEAVRYHQTHYENGSIHTVEEDGEVLGYYERYFDGDRCILYNVWVKEDKRKGRVFRSLYRHFFDTMPVHIRYVTGEKQKLGGQLQKVLISNRRRYGKHEDFE